MSTEGQSPLELNTRKAAAGAAAHGETGTRLTRGAAVCAVRPCVNFFGGEGRGNATRRPTPMHSHNLLDWDWTGVSETATCECKSDRARPRTICT
jgi:hypothetical protein